jgi:hypothetical protein
MARFFALRKRLIPCGLQAGVFRALKKTAQNAFFCKKSVLKHSGRFFGFCDLCHNCQRDETYKQSAAPQRDERKGDKRDGRDEAFNRALVTGWFASGGWNSPVKVSGDAGSGSANRKRGLREPA